jgi:DNA-binding NtrC family response regulator
LILGMRSLRGAPPEAAMPRLLPTVLVVAEAAAVRNAVARELVRDFELINATTFASAVRQLSECSPLAAIVVDLELSDECGAPWFLARLVDHAYEGPRILLSSALERERASSLRQGSVSHFTLARPWCAGELRSILDTTLGYSGLAWAPSQ